MIRVVKVNHRKADGVFKMATIILAQDTLSGDLTELVVVGFHLTADEVQEIFDNGYRGQTIKFKEL